MKTIFIVVGTTGEYADAHSWNVRAFTELTKAQVYARGCEEYANDVQLKYPYFSRGDARKEAIKKSPDPRCQIDYTGTEYTIETLDIA